MGKKQWNRFRGPIIKTIQKLANEAASPEGWLAKRLENPSVAGRDTVRAFLAEAFGLEPDAIPMGWTSMFDELAKAMEEMTKGVRGYLPAGPEVAGLLTGPTELEVEPEATEEQPSTAMDAQEALNRAGERFRNRRAAEALAQDTALPETGAEGESDLDGLAGNVALSVGEPKRGDTIVRRTTFDVEEDNERDVGYYYYVNDMPVAYASVRIFKDSTYVERIDVDDDYQNMGFGTRILKELADEYGDVYVAPDNEDAKRLYERIGYDKVGSRAYNESYYAVDEGYGVYSISGDSDTNIVIEGEDDGTGNVALSVGEDGTKGVDPGRVKSGLADFAKEWKSRGGLEYGDERELNAILDGANRFMDAYFGGAIALSNGGVLRFYPDRRAIERLGLERAWMEYAIHAVTHQKGEGERVRVYSRTKAKTLDDIREIVAADKCVIDKGDLVFIGNNGMSVVAEIVNKDAMRFDEERYITTKFTGSRLRRMAAVPLNTLMAPREGTVKSAGTSPSSTNTIANPGADVKPGNTAMSVGGFGLNANSRAEMEKVRKQYEGTDKWMKAPNGKPTKLNERQWLQVRTPSFKAWFGDWENDPANASKVVDENGEPLVVYHQTNSKAYINRETGQEWDRITPEERQAWRDRGDWDEHWEEQDFYTFDNTTRGRRSIEMPAFFFSPEYDEYHEYGNRTVAAFLNLRNPASNPEIPNAGVTDTAGEDAMNALMKQGYDGFIRDDDGAVYEINAFRPEQIKSATDNVGTFDPNVQDIRFSVGERMGGRAPVVEPGGDVREAGESTLAWLRRKFVHSQTPVFDAVRRVMGVGREPPDALNVEAAAKNVHGKIRARQEMLQRAYLEPLKAILAQPGMDRKRFDDYALALHALERNRMIQERSVVVDPTTGEVVDLGVEAGSGVTNAWAERVIREIQRDPFAAQYKEAANILAEMNRFVLRGAVADGLLTEAQARTWMRLSPHYVPLKSGGAAPGAIHKRATGRFTRPDSVLVNSMRQAYATVRNGELNRVNKTMADWIREYDPNGEQVGGTVPESHKHAKIKMAEPQYVPKGSTAEALLRERGIRLVETEDKGGYWVDTGVLPNALKRVVRESVPQGDDIVTFWENGERKFIRFEGKRGRDGRAENEAARIADALNFKNVLHKEGRFWDAIRGLTRWKANVSTSWNPTFIVRNMGADVFNTANLMMIEGKYAELARTMHNYPEALRTIARLHSLRREAGDSKMERMFMEAMQAGAFTGTYGLATFGDFENDLNTAIGEFSEMDAKNVLRKGTTQVTRALRKLGNAIDKVGAVPEMGMRLAVYVALRDSGWSQAQAAQYAREITVDFNAKGEWTPFFNTLYMFSNAAIQSFARYMKAFSKTRDEKGTARALGNLAVPIALNILIGYLAASALGDDDDDENGGLGADGRAGSTLENLNDYELENNLHIKLGNGITLRLPTRGTMAPFVYLGQKLAKYQRGLETEEEFLTDVALSMVQANLNFMGQSPTIGQQLAPTVADPLVQWLEGKDWAGRDLFRRDYGQAGSDAHQGFERTPWIYRSAVQALNELTGGDEVQSGAIDWRPESLKLFTDFILGSISQNAGSIANLADKLGGDESVETGVNDVPFIGGLVRETPDHTSRYYREFDRFDTLRKEMAMYESLAKNARTAEERQAYFAKANAMVAEHPELRFAKGLKRLSDNITDIRKTIREEEARPAEERNQAFIDFLEQQNLELMAEFLRALRR